MSPITTHVLDLARGRPAPGIPVQLARLVAAPAEWELLGSGVTDEDGRVRNLLPDGLTVQPGIYRLRFDTSALSELFPEISIQFRIASPEQRYHVPLLLSPYGYSTYRGS
ncbi:MAG TPA: hydroxyisourate hydrolase [Terriglobales bacterium]|nr:hydroxyisourate hydrolase [Terriglobales bacterium]